MFDASYVQRALASLSSRSWLRSPITSGFMSSCICRSSVRSIIIAVCLGEHDHPHTARSGSSPAALPMVQHLSDSNGVLASARRTAIFECQSGTVPRTLSSPVLSGSLIGGCLRICSGGCQLVRHVPVWHLASIHVRRQVHDGVSTNVRRPSPAEVVVVLPGLKKRRSGAGNRQPRPSRGRGTARDSVQRPLRSGGSSVRHRPPGPFHDRPALIPHRSSVQS